MTLNKYSGGPAEFFFPATELADNCRNHETRILLVDSENSTQFLKAVCQRVAAGIDEWNFNTDDQD
jgi:hypothetical protein